MDPTSDVELELLLHARVERLSLEISDAEAELIKLRKARSRAKKMSEMIGPPPEKTPPAKKKPAKIAESSIERVRSYLEFWKDELNQNGGFSATVLRRRSDWGGPATVQTIVEALRTLEKEGVVVLDHTGVAGSRFYTVA